MLIPILTGTTELIEKVKDGETIKNGCPSCQHDLVLKQFRVWGTFFLIPVAPRRDTRFVYECTSCNEKFDPVYRGTFINRANYINATPKEIADLTDALSLTILSSVLTCEDRTTENSQVILKEFATHYGISLDTHKEKFSTEILSQKDLSKTVFEWFNIFRDSFPDEHRNKALQQPLEYSIGINLTDKETKLLYTFSRHWGVTKEQFENLQKMKTRK